MDGPIRDAPPANPYQASAVRKWLLWFLSGVLVLCLGGAISLLVLRAVEQRRAENNRRITSATGIDALESVQLGGVRQWIQIRGHDRALPMLLFLHGGPGIPEMPFAYANAELEKHFVVVHWDQRGAGKSFDPAIPPGSMRIDQLVSDARELVNLLRQRFGQDRIFLAGHSTGSVVGVLLAQSDPELFRAYIGISQVANLQMTESFLYNFTSRAAEKSGNGKAQRELREIGPPPFATAKQLQVSQKWVNTFAPDPYGAISFARLRLLFFSPDCTLLDLVRIVRGAKFSFENLWREMFTRNLFREAPRLDVPVYFLEGRNDRVVTGEIAEKYFDALEAPRGKQLIWFEKSGHWPQLDEPAKFQEVLDEQVLAETMHR